MSDIVDRIDALVDEQLAAGEARTGFDYGDPTFPRCSHCERHWHGLPITARIAAMYARGEFDEDYRVDDDDSRVLCHGSEFIGPMPGEYPYPQWTTSTGAFMVNRGEIYRRLNRLNQFIQTALDFMTQNAIPEFDWTPLIYIGTPSLIIPMYRRCESCRLTIWPHQRGTERTFDRDGVAWYQWIHTHCAPALPAGSGAQRANPTHGVVRAVSLRFHL